MSGFPSKQPAKRDSTSTEMRNRGKSSFSARMGLVRSKQSPIERNLINRMRACVGRLRRRSLVFNLGFVDKHDGDVITYGIYAVALAALEAFPVMDHFYGCLTDRADQYFQQLRINRHAGMVAQGHTGQVFVGGAGGRMRASYLKNRKSEERGISNQKLEIVNLIAGEPRGMRLS